MYNPFSLEGKTILVTGASSGIGKAVSVTCSKMGARIIATGRDEARLEETMTLFEGNGHKSLAFDLTSEIPDELLTEIPSLNGIVHCAGISEIKMLRAITPNLLDKVMSTNFNGPVNLNNLLIQSKKVNKGGSIVFVSSISGSVATQIGEAAYAASKSAIIGYTKAAALELASRNIRINCILPGIIETPLLQTCINTFSEEEVTALKKKYPLRRFGQPEEVAHAVIFLLSEASSFITGSSIIIDGGFSIS